MSDPRIFICYRRDDGSHGAHRLYDALAGHFGEAEVFIDLDVPPGADIEQYLKAKLSSCAVVLVAIGPGWLTASGEPGSRRLDDEEDWVRLELEIALAADIAIVPLLLQESRMPSASDLPPSLRRLVGYNAQILSDGVHWRQDVRALISTLEDILERQQASVSRAAVPPRRAIVVSRAPSGWVARHRAALLLGVAGVVAVVAGVAVVGDEPEPEPLLIYSSTPLRQLDPLRRVPRDGSGHDTTKLIDNKRIADVRMAMTLAYERRGPKAARVIYEELDTSDASGSPSPALAAANAERAAKDRVAVYIGDFDSGSSQASIPILSKAGIPQISPGSTRVGLTEEDPRGDLDEPDRYYPPRMDGDAGYRNFVRLVPSDSEQAEALLAVMVRDRCRKAAMINDGTSYSTGLANNIRAANHHRVEVVFSQTVGSFGDYRHLVSDARRVHADCIVYSGSRNPNTVEMFDSFARRLPGAKLYGTDALAAASFYDPAKNGLPSTRDGRVSIMIPPRSAARYATFVALFARRWGDRHPDPFAIYGYEAMRLALVAIERSGKGAHNTVRNELFAADATKESMLGPYTFTDSGDIEISGYRVSRIKNGELTAPRPAAPGRDAGHRRLTM